ncbi:MAG: leucyl aminopeptidase [Deltaproteobacteria bacterium]|nr:leucyl aminopeptidase [Deltaproteobacteria bacterium]MBI4197133.1 leucyl aminopeptidase [Deltaproteobacteria bacterium]
MDFSFQKEKEIKTDLLVVGCWKEKKLSGLAARLDPKITPGLGQVLTREGFEFKAGSAKLIHTNLQEVGASNLLVFGLGEKSKADAQLIRRLGAAAVRWGNEVKAKKVSVEFLSLPQKMATLPFSELVVEGSHWGSYAFDQYKSEENCSKKTVERIEVLTQETPVLRHGLAVGSLVGEATNFARDLANTPSSDMTPRRMVYEAKKVARHPQITVEILDRKACEKLGMGAFLAVAKGSVEPPYLIHLVYRPKGRPRGRIAIVGKGITFDSGGLSIKTAQGMETMKFDMSGSAAMVAVLRSLPGLQIPLEVHGIAAMTENMPSGGADKPGDIARTIIGRSIEILNTDAEGRLTLADAIPYAIRQKPDFVIDIATLTGACVVGLGDRCAGIMGNDQKLIGQLVASGKLMGEMLWQLPLVEEYKEDLKSQVADVKNVGNRYGGAITAGLFLEQFVKPETPWAHIDIAGPAWAEKGTDLVPKGGTGFMVPTLLHFLLHLKRS